MELDQTFGDRQAQSGPTLFDLDGLPAVKALENLHVLVQGDAAARVADAKLDERVVTNSGVDANLSLRRREFDRVLDQVGENLVKLVSIRGDLDGIPLVHSLQRDGFILGERLQRFCDL